MSPDEFARRVREEQRRLEDDGGDDRLARQQRAVRFNHRVDPATGMIEFWGKLDPLRGMKFLNQLKERVARLFADKAPDDCPTDPMEKNSYLQALALLDLCEGHGQRSGRPEVIVVVDTRDNVSDAGPHVDWGIPVELPMRVLTDLVPDADSTPSSYATARSSTPPGVSTSAAPPGSRTPRNGERCERSTRDARFPTARVASTIARSTMSAGGVTEGAPTSTTCCPCV